MKMKRKLGAARENGEITSRQGKEAQPIRRDERPSGKNDKYTSADYRIAVELSNDPAIILSKSRRLIFNQKFLECLGYSHPDEIAGKPLFFSIYPEDIGLVLERSRI
ncbi:MAG: PAS domain-containing protein, partial [Syntrophales bacterium]|nr:PAS domain-containing protein [Syntrophales bacterium]